MIMCNVRNDSKACLIYPSIVLYSCFVKGPQVDAHNHGGRDDGACTDGHVTTRVCLLRCQCEVPCILAACLLCELFEDFPSCLTVILWSTASRLRRQG